MPSLFDQNPVTENQDIPAAVLTVGDISATDSDAIFDASKLDGDLNVWADYQMRNRYEKDYDRWMMGVTSPGGFNGASVAFVQLSSPTLLWVCSWTACQFNQSPAIPSNVPKDPDWVLLDELPVTEMVTIGPDGFTPLYRISGTYVYGHKNPSVAVTNNVSYPRPPWLQDTPERNVPPATLTNGLTDAPPNTTRRGGGN